MPTPRQWDGPDSLVAELRRCDWNGWFETGRASHASSDWQSMVKGAVGSNTFRAFRRLPNRPSFVFREWAYEALAGGSGYYEDLMAVRSQEEYDEWLNAFAGGLRRQWKREMGCEMPFGPSLKLPNLLMKTACHWSRVPASKARELVWRLHVPLDSYTIQAVRNCMELCGHRHQSPRIPTSAGMGYVDSAGLYRTLQSVIRAAAGIAGVPPVTLDLLAWDAAH